VSVEVRLPTLLRPATGGKPKVSAAGAVRCASQIPTGVIVVLSPDGGWKYLSSDVWSGNLEAVIARAQKTVYF
jgi:hypothetical protein